MQFDDKLPFVPTIKPLLQNVGMASVQIIDLPVLGLAKKFRLARSDLGWKS
jgi:hypothetical protein